MSLKNPCGGAERWGLSVGGWVLGAERWPVGFAVLEHHLAITCHNLSA